MTIHYVDKRNQYNGDGSLSTPAVSNGAPGAWNTINECLNRTYVADGDTVQLVPDSGPYTPDDIFGLSPGTLYFNMLSGTYVIFDLGGNILTSELYMSFGYEWHQSTVSGLYYATGTGGTDPATGEVVSGIVDGTWDAESTSLFGQYPGITDDTHHNKWGYGDVDDLGFDTVYIRGFDPSDGTHEILMSITNTKIIHIQTGATYIFQNGSIRGGGDYSAYYQTASATIINRRIEFQNTDLYAYKYTGSVTNEYCKFINCGHEASDAPLNGYNLNLLNCYFENVHTITKLQDTVASATTVTVRNCKSRNLLAAAFQHDSATMTLVEDHNQFHIDPVNIHGGDALAFTTGTRQWTVTDATDYPASTDTSLTTSVLPDAVPAGAGISIASVHEQTDVALDFNGAPVCFLPPNMGSIDGRTTIIISDDDYTPTGLEIRTGATVVITGGGDIDMSGLTEVTGPINVVLDGYINSFNGLSGITQYRWHNSRGSSSLMIGGVI